MCRFLVLDFRHANCIFYKPYYIVICGLPSSTAVATLSHKRHSVRGKDLWNIKVRFDFPYNIGLKYFLILRIIQLHVIKLHRSSSDFFNLNFLYTFSKLLQIQNFTKNRPVGADFHNSTYIILLAFL